MARRKLLLIILLGLTMRVGYAAVIYERSLLAYHYGDYTEYAIGAKEILQGDFSFRNSIYLIRPPLFPLFVAALGMQPFLIIAMNTIIASCIIPVTYLLARQMNLTRNLSLLAALVLALDPTSIKYSGVMLPEPLANLFLATALVGLITQKRSTSQRAIAMWGVLAGTCLAFSALTRPAAYLLWIPMAMWIVFARRDTGRRLLATLAFTVPALLGTGVWKYHNGITFGNSNFSTIGTYNLLYFRAAYILHWIDGRQNINAAHEDLARRVERRLGNEWQNVNSDWQWHHRAALSPEEAVMQEVALEVFLEHPFYYIYTIPIGLYRILLEVVGWPIWAAIAWNIGLLVTAVYGLWNMLRRGRWADGIFLVLPSAYFVLGTLLVQTSGIDTRARVMITPLLAVMAAFGTMFWLQTRKTESTRN